MEFDRNDTYLAKNVVIFVLMKVHHLTMIIARVDL